MAQNFMNTVKLEKPRSNLFDLTHDMKMSCKGGFLYPIMVQESVPGDSWNLGCESIVRLAPMLAPVMHRLDITMHYFFVPNRVVWANFERYIRNDPSEGPVPAYPYLSYTNPDWAAKPLLDYMGLPSIPTGGAHNVNAIPFAAYQMIYNEYYRDQNLVPPVDYKLTDGLQSNLHRDTDLLPLRRRAWEHDYFTSCLPEAQKGDPVELPLGNFQDVPVNVYDNTVAAGTDISWLSDSPSGKVVFADNQDSDNVSIANNQLYADTSNLLATSTSINDLRTAFRIQEFLEKNMRGGTRYIETILVHFGVKSSDKRLQRPEYITGSKSPITISEVLNTSGTLTEPQGNMAGHGVGYVQGTYGNYFAEEHGYVIGVMSIMPKTAYQQGIEKHWTKINSPYELYWPTFANLGEQEVLLSELWATATATDREVFGYLPRYAEYRTAFNRVAGEFRTSLNYWHMSRIFSTQPALNQTFIECTPTTRIFAIEDADIVDQYYVQILNKINVRRLMPKFGTPSF